MYILKNTNTNEPFAIIKNPIIPMVGMAIEEEFSLTNVKIQDFNFPDYCENKKLHFEGLDDDFEQFDGDFEITKIVSY